MTVLCSNKESEEDAEDREVDETSFQLESYDYELPPDLIAQKPLDQRDQSRLMVLTIQGGIVAHTNFFNIIEYLRPGDLVVINNNDIHVSSVSSSRTLVSH